MGLSCSSPAAAALPGEPREQGSLQQRAGGFWTSGMKAIDLKMDLLEKNESVVGYKYLFQRSPEHETAVL